MDKIPYISVKSDPNGGVKVEAQNFTGGECLKETMKIEQALGKTGARTKKASFFERTTSVVKKLYQKGS